MTAATSVNNYEYLDILDCAWTAAGLARPEGGALCDIGCASFWYASALAAFFRPREIVGVEIEGYRLFKDGRTRIDYAQGYLAQLPQARFVTDDYARYVEPADVITAWFPFLTPASVLAWRLPLSMLEPQRLFQQIRRNLRPGGLFVMINHGIVEAQLAEVLCKAAGLRRISSRTHTGVLGRHRARPPVVSCWNHA